MANYQTDGSSATSPYYIGHILRAPSDDPVKQTLFEQGTDRPRIEHTRRVGKPRANWFVEAPCRDADTACDPNTECDEHNIARIRVSPTRANNREAPFNRDGLLD